MNEVYVMIDWQYEYEVNIWQFKVVVPVYKIDWGRIVKIYRECRWYYPLAILEATKIDNFPREGWEIIPGEKIIDSTKRYWRDADMFVALSWHTAQQVLSDCNDDRTDRMSNANMTWAWFPIINDYNFWYKFDAWHLIAASKPDLP